MVTFELSNNNSGGSFWIGRKDVDALLEAGWYVHEDEDDGFTPIFGDKDNYFRTGCSHAELHNLRFNAETVQEAVESFERVTGQDLFALGCTCCGAPFRLTDLETGESYGGDYVSHVPQRPF
jgi:hypothetical protein